MKLFLGSQLCQIGYLQRKRLSLNSFFWLRMLNLHEVAFSRLSLSVEQRFGASSSIGPIDEREDWSQMMPREELRWKPVREW